MAALAYVLLWASAFVPGRVLSALGQPLWILAMRFAVATVLLASIVAIRGPRPGRSSWLPLAACGVLAHAAYLGLTWLALRRLSASMGAIIASTNPLLLAIVAPAALGEPIGVRTVAGLVVAFSGVLVAMATRADSTAAEPRDVLLALGGVIALVVSTLLMKRRGTQDDPLVANTIQLAAASVALLPAAMLVEGPPRIVVTPAAVASFVYLVVAISLGASVLWLWLLRREAASRVSAYYFLTPIVGLAFGALILGEPLHRLDGVGFAAVAAGIVLAHSRRRTRGGASGVRVAEIVHSLSERTSGR